MKRLFTAALVCLSLAAVEVSAYTRDDLVRDYQAECSFMESGLFTTTDIQWHSVQHDSYIVSIALGEGDDGIIIRNFLPDEQDLKATFNSRRGSISIPVQEWPFDGYEFCHGSSDMQYSDDAPVVVALSADPSGQSDFIIDFPQGSWAVRDAQYGDYISIIKARTRLVAGPKPQDGVDGIEADTATEQGRYYNLQGVEVENPGHGVFIYVSGSKATKLAR